ncbi:hypothetical protein LCGC14_0787960 [marine sediment metagenome]|uniref:Uncharacterized protein n=1 Tax=marine sediment metagenome TaxID=412755 RepID=A0A0F9SDC5_9ZZZZ
MNEYFYIELADNMVSHMKQYLDNKDVRPGDVAFIKIRCEVVINFGDDTSMRDFKLKLEWDDENRQS